jgi:hypothetical protein
MRQSGPYTDAVASGCSFHLLPAAWQQTAKRPQFSRPKTLPTFIVFFSRFRHNEFATAAAASDQDIADFSVQDW